MTRLSILPAGARARVVLLAPDLRDGADRLVGLGLWPGSDIQLLQRAPEYVVEVGETRLAIDEKVARRIFVQRLP